MIILGVDPGLAHTGYAIIKTKGESIENLVHGCITTNKKDSLEKRLKQIHQDLIRLINKHRPEKIAVEQLFFCKNAKTALIVGHARGVIYLAAAENRIALSEFTPLQVKQALTGYGRADKSQVKKMIKVVLGLKKVPASDDAADAIAIAYCALRNKKLPS